MEMEEYGQRHPAIGHLTVHTSDHPPRQHVHILQAGQQLDIGRRTVCDAVGVEDRRISKHHVAIHGVTYEDAQDQVAPMVWARVLSNNAVVFRRSGRDADDGGGGVVIGKGHEPFLLSHGDSILLTRSVWIEFAECDDYSAGAPRLDASQQAETAIFKHRYRVARRVLGVGGYGAVYVASDERTGRQLACKIVKQAGHETPVIAKQRDPKRTQAYIAREFNVLKNLSHPNIISLEAVFVTPFNVYIFQDLVTGGDLMSYVQMKPLNEPQAAVILRQLLEAVSYLHGQHVVHRDIKPENILMTSFKDGGRIVLTDFGQSRTIADLQKAAKEGGFRMQTLVGTVGYVAPEVLRLKRQDIKRRSGYSTSIDIWSVGCVACAILGNDVPFPVHRTADSLSLKDYDRYMECLDHGENWSHVGRRAKDFIRACLTFDQDARPTASQALATEWFTHSHYRAEMDAAYRRAIADWKCKSRKAHDLVEYINTTQLVAKAERDTQTSSKHFDPAAQSLPRERCSSNPHSIIPHRPQREPFEDSMNIPDPNPPTFLRDLRLHPNLSSRAAEGSALPSPRKQNKMGNVREMVESCDSIPRPPAFFPTQSTVL